MIRVTLCNLIAQCDTLITIQIQWRLLSAFFITWPSLAQSLASLKRHKKSRKIEIREYLDCYCSSLIKQIYITTKRDALFPNNVCVVQSWQTSKDHWSDILVYRVSQQVWNRIKAMFWSSEMFASEASFVYVKMYFCA